jgi:hypothetical protein
MDPEDPEGIASETAPAREIMSKLYFFIGLTGFNIFTNKSGGI